MQKTAWAPARPRDIVTEIEEGQTGEMPWRAPGGSAGRQVWLARAREGSGRVQVHSGIQMQ